MALTPATLARHELVGLNAEVVASPNADLVGVAGEVVTETTKTLGLAGAERVRQVPKEAATFTFALPDGSQVRVEGGRLVARPAERSEQRGDSIWR